MSHKERTSLRTTLGLVLQSIVDASLVRGQVPFLSNYCYYKGFIKPDLLVPQVPPNFSIHVTATSGDDNFRRKKWRYIDEITQLRSVWGNAFVSINVLFGPTNGYRDADIKLMRHLFDRNLETEHLRGGSEVFQVIETSVEEGRKEGKSASRIVEELMAHGDVSSFIDALWKDIAVMFSDNVSNLPKHSCDQLNGFLRVREESLQHFSSEALRSAFWKKTLLRFLAVTPEFWQRLFDIKTDSVLESHLPSRAVKEATRARLVTHVDGVIKKLSLIDEVGVTIHAGLSIEFLNNLKQVLEINPRRKWELQDLWDDGKRATEAVSEVVQAVKGGPQCLAELVGYSLQNGGSYRVAHHRAHVLDVVIALINSSQNELQKLYRGPEFGVKNPVPNLVPRTDIAVLAIEAGKLDSMRVAQAIVDSIWHRIAQVDLSDLSELVERYLTLRVNNLLGGGSVDPLEDFVAESVSAAGWSLEKSSISINHPLTGKIAIPFTAVASKGNKRLFVKCLFGDTGADHKAEEMEARMRLVRLALANEADVYTVFVADGKWSKNNLASLVLGGWDHIVSVVDFPKLIRAF